MTLTARLAATLELLADAVEHDLRCCEGELVHTPECPVAKARALVREAAEEPPTPTVKTGA